MLAFRFLLLTLLLVIAAADDSSPAMAPEASPVEPTSDSAPVEPTSDSAPVEPTSDSAPVEPTSDGSAPTGDSPIAPVVNAALDEDPSVEGFGVSSESPGTSIPMDASAESVPESSPPVTATVTSTSPVSATIISALPSSIPSSLPSFESSEFGGTSAGSTAMMYFTICAISMAGVMLAL